MKSYIVYRALLYRLLRQFLLLFNCFIMLYFYLNKLVVFYRFFQILLFVFIRFGQLREQNLPRRFWAAWF